MQLVELCQSEAALDARARRAAKRVGLLARKSTWGKHTVDNRGGYMIIEPICNVVVAGERFDLSADEVIAICTA